VVGAAAACARGSWPLVVLLIGDDLLSNRDEADTLVGLR
jgi:hypothetical protein